jgi:hypothetical protein
MATANPSRPLGAISHKLVRVGVPAIATVVGAAVAIGLVAAAGAAPVVVASIGAVAALGLGGAVAGATAFITRESVHDRRILRKYGHGPGHKSSGKIGQLMFATAVGGLSGLAGSGVGLVEAPSFTRTVAAASTIAIGSLFGWIGGLTATHARDLK